MLNIFKNKYFVYASSILFGKGTEILSIFFLSYYFTKEEFGTFEFYRKTLEFLSIFVAFGGPILIMANTRNKVSKIYYFFNGIIISIAIILFSIPILLYFDMLSFFFAILYYALFFHSNSIIQAFLLVYYGSNKSALYKYIVATLFSSILLIFSYLYKEKSIIYTANLMLFITSCYLFLIILKEKKYLNFKKLKKYFYIYSNKLALSISIVINNIMTIAFFATDIFIIKYFSTDNGNIEISNLSFVLLVTNLLLLISITFSQVDIEKLKFNNQVLNEIVIKIRKFNLLFIVMIISIYFLLINTFFEKYNDTVVIFFIMLVGKYMQSISIPYGYFLMIKNKYLLNMKINIFIFVFNVLIGSLFYIYFGLLGLILTTSLSLGLRFYIAYIITKRMIS